MSRSVSHNDISRAVASGIIDQPTADRLTSFLAGETDQDVADEEQIRLVTSFNDIFVTIGIALFLGALSYLTSVILMSSDIALAYRYAVSAAIVAIAAWLLAEPFTRRRHMALPSIVLLAVFVVHVGLAAASVAEHGAGLSASGTNTSSWIVGFIAAGIAAVAHWLRFHVPITIAAGAAAAAGILLSAIGYFNQDLLTNWPYLTVLPAGLVIFAIAMYFDASDRMRVTRNTDIAFWLHLLAAPLIVHPIVYPIYKNADASASGALAVIILFVLLAAVALLIDRRALLVSSLTYLGYAATAVLKNMGGLVEGYGLAVLLVGAVVLLLSVGWQSLRRAIIGFAPRGLLDFVPPLDQRPAFAQRGGVSRSGNSPSRN